MTGYWTEAKAAHDAVNLLTSRALQTIARNTEIHRMVAIEGQTLAAAAAKYEISRNRAMQIVCRIAGTRTLTEARAKHSKGEVSCA
ncbi:hypothetical protein [Cupriavidus numazuensis]|uniref:Mor transcription activator domain-containing protein n=1 Tax=Cupriavidus numazuensis TaxID=221992 RepID=A0ABN7PWT4_9BURK|nr:hypothetical protein [Cupriavidus numazuensis]CAG2132385.1 hypothetical protein LMG26411_00609 [Cupriavidus numazuensis]